MNVKLLLISIIGISLTSFTPPGTIKVKDTYIDVYEVSNLDWLEYVYAQGGGYYSETDVTPYLPDSAEWSRYYNLSSPYHSAAHEGPVVGVSRKQAMGYCAYRTKAVNIKYGKGGARKVIYRLPTEEELKEVLQNKSYNKAMEVHTPNYLKTLPLKKHNKHPYYLQSNLYEYVNKEGVYLKGGQYVEGADTFVTLLPDNAFVGFRCVAELVVD